MQQMKNQTSQYGSYLIFDVLDPAQSRKVRSSQRSFFKHILAAVCCELSVQSAGGRKSARNGTKLIALGDSSGDKLLDFGQA